MRTARSRSISSQDGATIRKRRTRRGPILAAAVVLLVGVAAPTAAYAAAPKPADSHSAGQPNLGDNVIIFNPTMSQAQIQSTVDAVAAQQISNQFGTQRYTLFFQPGTYGSAADPLTFDVGYYTQVAGLGLEPGDVIINGTINVHNQCDADWLLRVEQLLAIDVEPDHQRGRRLRVPDQYRVLGRIAGRPDASGRRQRAHFADGLLRGRAVLRERRFHRRLEVHRRNGRQRFPAAVPGAQQRSGRVDQRRLEPGLLR